MVAKKAYSQITVAVVYHHNVNTIYMDGIQLFKEEYGTSYTYDDNGNVISVVDLQKKNTTYEYTNNNLTKILEDGKAKVTYTYDDYHNVKTAKTEEGLEYGFTYDKYGNNTTVTIGSGTTKISSSASYTSDGNYTASVTDALDKVTSYKYNENTGVLEWVKYPNDTDATKTKYTYDSMFRTASAACTTDTGDSMSAKYTYTNDLLASVKTASTTYNFTYGSFGLRQNVKVNTQVLAGYEYTNDRNKYLAAIKYGGDDGSGNGKAGMVEYDYDSKGRLITQTYEDGDTVTYRYDNNGNLAKVIDSATGRTATYFYDLIDRMVKYEEKGTNYSHSVSYKYDKQNNLSKQVEVTNGVTTTTTYTYDDDNRTKTVSTGNTTVTYTYDAYGRTSKKVTKNGDTTYKTETYTYTAPKSNATSSQIASHTTVCGGVTTTYAYTYDSNGNILTVSDGTKTTSYTYDSQNQLLRENNQAGGFTHTWEYDNAGNIVSRKEYAYTTGSLGNTTDTVSYVYGNGNWGDLLTSYDGTAITYDEIGNPNAIGGWSFTWEHGRELASMTNGTTTWTNTYNADGMRTKRTNGTKTYEYTYNGSQLTQMKQGTNTYSFTYDANGTPLTVTQNGTAYYYATNLQGDVVSILIRYRGYVYDAETGLYYLQSRYYNPVIGRFLNADNQISTGDFTGLNMFAYCGNNPVIRIDPTGEAWEHWLVGAAVVAGFALLTVATCGGSLALAATSVCLVGGGVAAATTATTVAAAAFIGATVTYCGLALDAMCNSDSADEFAEKGNWGTVAATTGSALLGGASGYSMSKAQTPTSDPTNTSRGSTGRTEPANLREKLAMEQVKSNPSAGTPLTKITLNDPRWPSSEGWVKMQQIVPTSQGNINIHYVYNQTLKIFDDFKFKP